MGTPASPKRHQDVNINNVTQLMKNAEITNLRHAETAPSSCVQNNRPESASPVTNTSKRLRTNEIEMLTQRMKNAHLKSTTSETKYDPNNSQSQNFIQTTISPAKHNHSYGHYWEICKNKCERVTSHNIRSSSNKNAWARCVDQLLALRTRHSSVALLQELGTG